MFGYVYSNKYPPYGEVVHLCNERDGEMYIMYIYMYILFHKMGWPPYKRANGGLEIQLQIPPRPQFLATIQGLAACLAAAATRTTRHAGHTVS